jgi:DNA-binding transcriptional regulator GbsR (MarR family)
MNEPVEPNEPNILDDKVATQHCVDAFGEMAIREFMPAIAGKIAALLHVSDTPVSFGELERQLNVSRGSISSNTRLLEETGLIERIIQPGKREHSFRFVYDMKLVSATFHVRRLQESLELLQLAHAALRARASGISPELRRKMSDFENFYQHWIGHMNEFLSEMRSGED